MRRSLNFTLSHLLHDVGKIMSTSQTFNVANLSFETICENRVLTKISEFTVYTVCCLRPSKVDQPVHPIGKVWHNSRNRIKPRVYVRRSTGEKAPFC